MHSKQHRPLNMRLVCWHYVTVQCAVFITILPIEMLHVTLNICVSHVVTGSSVK